MDIKLAWVLVGYELFSTQGPQALKVETIARKVGKSKSSFYHHFGDVEIFIEALLKHHLAQVKIIAERERLCKNVLPDLLHVLIEFKQDLLFNRQLRINRHIALFKKCFEKATEIIGDAILPIWSKELGLGNKAKLASLVLNLSIENLFLQITAETLNYEWLASYINELRHMVSELKKANT
jgi:AcrR family transcriptional regulator